MLKTSEAETDQETKAETKAETPVQSVQSVQSVPEASAGQVRAKVLAVLLERYYAANGTQQKRLEDEILKHSKNLIKQRVYAEGSLRDDFDDLCQGAQIAIAKGLRATHERGPRIRSFPAWARWVIANVIIERKRKNTPRRIMDEAVLHIVTDSPHKVRFARWYLVAWLLIGLRSQQGKAFVETMRYRAFCQDDTPFVQQGLQGRDPKDTDKVELWELMENFLAWIETPMERKQLVAHLLHMQPINPLITVPLPHGSEDYREPQAALYAEDSALDWEPCWEAVRAFTPKHRAVFLLSRDCDELVCLTAQPAPEPLLASVLEVSAKEMHRLWKRLPLENDEIARYLKTSVENVYVMRRRCKLDILRCTGIPTRL